MENGPRKASTTPYGSTVVQGAQSVCGMCLHGSCPIHQRSGAAPSVVSEAQPRTLGDVLDTVVDSIVDRVCAHIGVQLREMEDRLQLSIASLVEEEETYVEKTARVQSVNEDALLKLADALDEEGIKNFYVVDEHGVVQSLMVEQAETHSVVTVGNGSPPSVDLALFKIVQTRLPSSKRISGCAGCVSECTFHPNCPRKERPDLCSGVDTFGPWAHIRAMTFFMCIQ